MSPEVALLSEVWSIVKSHVHTKERVEVAESILCAFEDHVDISELEIYKNEFDSSMKAVIKARSEDYGDDEDEDDDWG